MNLRTIPDMAKRFNLPVGLSDHTIGVATSIASVCLGAKLVEKHFCLSRKIETPDSFFSLEPQEFRLLVENIRIAEKALGKVHYGLTEDEKKSLVFRRSLFVVKDVRKGEIFNEENVKSIRPAYGLPPKYLSQVIGKKASRNIKRGTPLNENLIQK
jgi:pseudaminic acid synthase